MKFTEIKDKSKEELNKMLEELKIKLGEMKFQVSSNALKNTNQIKEAKRDIARVLSALSDSNMRMHTNDTNKIQTN